MQKQSSSWGSTAYSTFHPQINCLCECCALLSTPNTSHIWNVALWGLNVKNTRWNVLRVAAVLLSKYCPHFCLSAVVFFFFFFTNSERDAPYRLLKASEKLRQSEPGSELVCVLVWQVTDESQGCGEGIVPAWGGGFLLGTVSRHPLLTYTHMHPSANTDRFVHPFVSVRVCQSQVLDILCLGCLALYLTSCNVTLAKLAEQLHLARKGVNEITLCIVL